MPDDSAGATIEITPGKAVGSPGPSARVSPWWAVCWIVLRNDGAVRSLPQADAMRCELLRQFRKHTGRTVGGPTVEMAEADLEATLRRGGLILEVQDGKEVLSEAEVLRFWPSLPPTKQDQADAWMEQYAWNYVRTRRNPVDFAHHKTAVGHCRSAGFSKRLAEAAWLEINNKRVPGWRRELNKASEAPAPPPQPAGWGCPQP
jgi:hypothetical protein